ncbi:phage tail sheath C-terminal domain-containing protein [Desulfosporosinus nitroreducens]|uniref:phage tail sheath C-terminal domain-containing protein n=1 Tax=Desulfosporosinus nitroreducens TaxID=2018668 RepID=UPI00207C7E7B|nr:phage tail sheath C-terminal domain-containing protein [Desulfosporosinus nitroreducens]MCO1599826.1 phage tail sheath protein [Desulfosporosinus nitroreducens]
MRGAAADIDYTTQLGTLALKKWDWMAIPGIAVEDVADVSVWLIARRAAKKTFKAVLPNSVSDHEGIVNFATAGIVVGANTYTASQYTARIAGILSGLSLTRSATYFILPEVEGITESAEPDDDIDAGKLILISQNGVIKIGRGVNSLTTTTVSKSKVFKKIKIVEGIDLIKSDVSKAFADEYVGKVVNIYDNQVLFITAVNSYLRSLEGDVLDPKGENTVGVNVTAQRAAWEGVGTDTTEMTDQEIKEKAFESNVFLGGNLKFADAMEDLSFEIAM